MYEIVLNLPKFGECEVRDECRKKGLQFEEITHNGLAMMLVAIECRNFSHTDKL